MCTVTVIFSLFSEFIISNPPVSTTFLHVPLCTDLDISGPLETERQKLEMIAKSLGVNVAEKSDDELRKIISGKMGQKNKDESENKV